MARKLVPKKKKVEPVNHEEVKSAYTVEKRNIDGSKDIVKEKGVTVETEDNPVGALPEGKATIGLSKGLTVNLGNYESAKINCWVSRTVDDNDKTIMDNLVEISNLIDEQLQFEVDELSS